MQENILFSKIISFINILISDIGYNHVWIFATEEHEVINRMEICGKIGDWHHGPDLEVLIVSYLKVPMPVNPAPSIMIYYLL